MSEANANGGAGATAQAQQTEVSGDTKLSSTGSVPGQNGEAGNAVKEAAREAIRKLKVQYQDGKEEEVDEDEVLKVYRDRKGHQSAANKLLQEGKAAKKQAETFVQMMKDKGQLFQAIQKLGHDPRQLAEEYLASQLQDEMMDPREREFKEAKLKIKKYEEIEKQQKEQEQKKRDDALKAKFSEDYSNQFVDALKASNIPANKATIAEMAKYIHRAASMNFEMTAAEAAKLVKEDIENAHRNIYGDADAETLVKLLGDQGLQKIRTYDTSRLKDPMANLKTPTEQTELKERVRSTGKRMSAREWRQFNRK